MPESTKDTPDVEEVRERIEPFIARHDSEEGRAVINGENRERSTGHVLEIWEDGEVTSTKGGELFRKRTLHRKMPPFLTENLWEVPEAKSHESRVIIDNKIFQVLDDYTDVPTWRLPGADDDEE